MIVNCLLTQRKPSDVLPQSAFPAAIPAGTPTARGGGEGTTADRPIGQRRFRWSFLAYRRQTGALLLYAVCFLVSLYATSASAQSFKADVEPLIQASCIGCHDADTDTELNFETLRYDLTDSKTFRQWQEVFDRLQSGKMPPKKKARPDPSQLERALKAIKKGLRDKNLAAAHRQYWAFRKLRRPAEPNVKSVDRIRTPIDAFVLSKLEDGALTFAPDADRTTLVRRAYLDLIGLPPQPDEVEAFLADDQPGAYERLIDRLLASPHFGERWGRHWLDAVGYVDTEGFGGGRPLRGKWRYRQYVIESLNEDKPYDEFVREQIAGDEQVDWRSAERFTPEIRNKLVATGFLRTAADFSGEGSENNIPSNHYAVIHDTLDIVATSLLGLTLKCARCHSHKFDPIPQEDYYRLMVCLTPAYNSKNWKAVADPFHARQSRPEAPLRTLPDVSAAEQVKIEEHNGKIDHQVEELDRTLAALRGPYEKQLFEKKLVAVPESVRIETRTAVETPAKRRTKDQKNLASRFAEELKVSQDEVTAALSGEDRTAASRIEKKIKQLRAKRRSWGVIQALYDVGPPPPARLLLRGNYEMPGDEVRPGFLSALSQDDEDNQRWFSVSASVGETSGRRTALARWLTDLESPASALLARVMVNRLWQHVFGQGIVATSDNLGHHAVPPTHPRLLEWLSDEFVVSGWRIKPLIKLMVMSSVYRQTSAPSMIPRAAVASAESVDPDNQLLWRMRLRRLESEIIRDSILATAGQLDLTIGGPPIPIKARDDGLVVVSDEGLSHPAKKNRRSVYVLSRRANNPTLLTLFDQPFIATTCSRRHSSAVVSQSLTMLHDAFLFEQAERFAERVAQSSSGVRPSKVGGPTPPGGKREGEVHSREDEIEIAFQLALTRKPTAKETAWCVDLLSHHLEAHLNEGQSHDHAVRQALVQLCHTLLNTSEFLYVE